MSTTELWLIVAAMFVVPVLVTLLQAQHNVIMLQLGVRMKTITTVAIYRKALSMQMSAGIDAGKISTRMSVDAAQLDRFTQFCNMVFVAPVQIIVSLVLIYGQVCHSVAVNRTVLTHCRSDRPRSRVLLS